MYLIIWKYTVNPTHLQSFIEYYHAAGEWVKFFHQSNHYFGTDFIALDDDENTFVTVDKWMTPASYEQFLEDHKSAYLQLDKHCEGFTIEEKLVGKYFTVEM
jgi:hypothetical protein